MRLLLLSDTHGQHAAFTEQIHDMGPVDVIIHAGDITRLGSAEEASEFVVWLSQFKNCQKLFIGGNHDKFLYDSHLFGSADTFRRWAQRIDPSLVYLDNSGMVIDGVRFWGSAFTPAFMNWYYMYQPGKEARQIWEQVPQNTNVLITHGPPIGIQDKVEGWSGGHVGCVNLAGRVLALDQLKLHVFGHIHNGYGQFTRPSEGQKPAVVNFYQTGFAQPGMPTFVNAALLNEQYKPVNKPILIEL